MRGAGGVPTRNRNSALGMGVMPFRRIFGGLSRVFTWEMGKGFLG